MISEFIWNTYTAAAKLPPLCYTKTLFWEISENKNPYCIFASSADKSHILIDVNIFQSQQQHINDKYILKKRGRKKARRGKFVALKSPINRANQPARPFLQPVVYS